MASVATTLREALADRADPQRAQAQQRYMKSSMPFRGVGMAEVRALAGRALKQRPATSQTQMLALARALWEPAQFREERYLALAVCRDRAHASFQDSRCLPTYLAFIRSGAWWDLVDETSTLVGLVLDRDPEPATAIVRGWITDADMWVRRAAIICQRARGDRSDRTLLEDALVANLDDQEFFIRKAAGWALRQYARTDPNWVRDFVAQHEARMSALTRREALKHLT
jgi:3-methyladenine DNA glycosylase AlkD